VRGLIEGSVVWLLGGLLGLIVLAGIVRAETGDAGHADVDKSVYHLFNPTPSKYLRTMDTDGPGATESPYTVDAGHFQIELTFLAYASERDPFDGETYKLDAWAFAPIILKVGLLNQLDAQLVLEPYQIVKERIGSRQMTSRGFGDLTLRLKHNIWGNDGGRTALAMTPYVKFPTSAEGLGNNSVEGGLILPLSVDLPEDFWLGLTTRFDAVRDWASDGYHAEFMNSIAFGHELFAEVFGYVEFFSLVSAEGDGDWVGTFNMGLIYSLTANLQLNAGVNIGLTRSAYDWNPFAGVAWRF
jgi:hypothetical protein